MSRPSACRRSPPRSSCTSTSRATGSTAARRARSAGPFPRRSACARPTRDREIVAISGDYDFQFMIEELAVGAQFKLPYIHVVVNNSYLGLIRQSQRGFKMDYCGAAVVRERQRAGDRRLRRRSRQGRRRARLQGDPRHRPGTTSPTRSSEAQALDGGIRARRWSSRSSWSA